MNIVPLTKELAEGVYQVCEACFSQPWSAQAWRQEAVKAGSLTLVAVEDNRVLGFCNANTVLEEANLNNIAVFPSEQGKGIGEKLMKALIAQLQERQVQRMYLEMRVSNDAARKLYQKHGFIQDGIRKNFYEKPVENAVLMSKNLLHEQE